MGWFEQVRLIWSRLPGHQRVFMISVVIALVVVFTLVFAWAGREEYEILYGNLEAKSAGAIVDELRSRDVPYKLRDGGGTILVPRAQVHEARVDLATAGLPQASGQGYELLDTNKLGWTDFVQKLQFRRALEGEIARTIQALNEVSHARVHLVIPEPSLFQKDEKPTTASVMIKLRTGARLRDPQVQGIVHLVAAGVEGLTPENITVLDTNGRLLSKPADEESLLGSAADQVGLTHQIEEGLARKAQTALEQVLGPNKIVVRVSVDLDLERAETTRELYDSENPAIRSEQRTEQSSAEAGTSEESVTNYEISKTIQRIVEIPGSIKRLSASVFIDGTYETTEEGERIYAPRSQEEMDKLSGLIKTTLGFDATRGDELSIANIAFDDTEMLQNMREMERAHRLDMIQKVGGIAVSLLLAGGALLILWRIFKRGTQETVSSEVEAIGHIEEIEDAEARRVAKDARILRLEKKVQEISKDPAEEIARIVRAWLKEA
ncbi:MAG: flagellar M-ring protein FliF [Candidatus Eisenbacteria sp.]|nr:flagellar M-ring protein FliF [Candidatus Eisenbacteria bacterium]